MKKFIIIFAAMFLLFQIVHCTLNIDNCEGQWVQTNGPSAEYVSCLAISGSNIFAGTYGGGVYLSTNNGGSWTAVNNGITNPEIGSLAIYGNNIFAGGAGVFLSTNNGGSWTAVNNGLTNQSVFSLVVNGNSIFAGTAAGVFHSTNNGGNWTGSGLSNLNVWSLAVSGNNIIAGTEALIVGGLYLSTNNGGSWTNIGILYVWSLVSEGNNVFAGSLMGGVYLSTNNGVNWNSAGSFNHGVNSLAVSGTYIFAGTDSGVYATSNLGANWFEKNQGFDSVPRITSLLIGNDYVFAGTNDQSVWKRLYSEITGIKQISGLVPFSFSLEQNYPNPFNPVTNLEFGISDLGFVSLKVYDILGKEVTTLVNEKQSQGTYQVEFDGSGLTSGVYFYRLVVSLSNPLNAGEFTETKQMMLLK